MREWTDRARKAARKRLDEFGLRVACLACSWRGRWWLGEGVGEARHARVWRHVPDARLRDVRCPVCGAIALRAVYWIERHPELAAEAKRRAVLVARELG